MTILSKIVISVIVVYVDRDKALLKDCIVSLEDSAKVASVKLRFILVANGTSVSNQTKFIFPVTNISVTHNVGFGAAVNRGLAEVKTEWCIISCPDTRCEINAIKALHPYMNNPKIALIGPKVFEADGNTQATIVPILTLKNIFIEQTYLYKLFPAVFTSPLSDRQGYNYAHCTDAIAAIWWLANCDALRQVAGFDERYFLYFEDVDLCKRLGEAGYSIFYVPQAQILHLLHQSTGGAASGVLYRENMRKFLKKHYGDFVLYWGSFFLIIGSIVRLIYWSLRTTERAKYEKRFYREILYGERI